LEFEIARVMKYADECMKNEVTTFQYTGDEGARRRGRGDYCKTACKDVPRA
jgi:hypothetical protein